MKKLRLNSVKEVLTRDEMRSINGGEEQEQCPQGWFWCTCTNDSGTVSGCVDSIYDCYTACE